MTILIYSLSLTNNGKTVAKKLTTIFDDLETTSFEEIKSQGKQLSTWLEDKFKIADAIIFIGATSICVRLIAPFLKSKKLDPAVIVIDEKASFVIPILSGHLGGANDLARKISSHLLATPVITTATDLNGLFAVDVFAKNNNLEITDFSLAKEVSARLLRGENVFIYSQYPIEGNIPKELTQSKTGDFGIYVGEKSSPAPFEKTLFLVPKNFFLGVGMKKGTDVAIFENSALLFLEKNGVSLSQVAQISSAKIKQQEEAILTFARKYGLKKSFFDEQDLESLKGEFSSSDFVKKITGASNICERSAVLASNGGCLVMKKTIINHITFALAKGKTKIKF